MPRLKACPRTSRGGCGPTCKTAIMVGVGVAAGVGLAFILFKSKSAPFAMRQALGSGGGGVVRSQQIVQRNEEGMIERVITEKPAGQGVYINYQPNISVG